MGNAIVLALLVFAATPAPAQSPAAVDSAIAEIRAELVRSRGFIRSAETQHTKLVALVEALRELVASIPAAPVVEELGALEIGGAVSGSTFVTTICDGVSCDLTWSHGLVQEGPDYEPPAYAAWYVEGDPLSVELPAWPSGPGPVTMGGVTATPVTEGPCAYPILPRGPANQFLACRAPDRGGDGLWLITWSRVDVSTIAPETLRIGLPVISDLRVVRRGPDAVAVEWTQVGNGAGGAADYGIRWSTPDGWSEGVAVAGSRVGDRLGYTAFGLAPGVTVTIEVAPFRGLIPERAVYGPPASVTAETTAAGSPPLPVGE